MGRRVDNAQNEVVAVGGDAVADSRLQAEEAVFCPNCGDPDGQPPQGYATVEYAEQNWLEANGQLCCSIYCFAKVSGLTEEQAQLARGEKTRADMRAEGRGEEADADEASVAAMVAEEHLERTDEQRVYPFAARLADIAEEGDAPHGIPDQGGFDEVQQSEAEAILAAVQEDNLATDEEVNEAIDREHEAVTEERLEAEEGGAS